MNNIKRLIIFTFFLVIILSGSINAEMSITINPNNPSLSLVNGQSKLLYFSINNDNSICSVNCNYELKKDGVESIDYGNFNSGPSVPNTISLTFRAPTKSEVRQDLGTIDYLLTVSCSTIIDSECWVSESKTRTTTVTLNYDITQSEKDDKTYLDSIFPDFNTKLKICESIVYNLNSKIDNVSYQVDVSDITNNVNSYNTDYLDYKTRYDYARNLYEQIRYKEARLQFDPDILNQLDFLINNIDNSSNQIDYRIELHNRLVTKVNSLKQKINDVKSKGEPLNMDLSQMESDINILENRLSSRSKKNYNEMLVKANSIERDLGYMNVVIDNRTSEIINSGNQIIAHERSKFNLGYEVYPIGNIESVNKICNKLNETRAYFQNEADKQLLNYEALTNNVSEYNGNIFLINYRLSKINPVVNNINQLSNSRYFKSFDINKCKKEIENISKFDIEQLKRLNSSYYSSCLILSDSLSNSKEIKKSILDRVRIFSKRFSYGTTNLINITLLPTNIYPTYPSIVDFSDETRDYSSRYCGQELFIVYRPIKLIDYVEKAKGIDLNSSEIIDVKQIKNMCCSLGICLQCCENNDCLYDEKSYPVIFLHGHSFLEGNSPEYSLDAFNNLQDALNKDKYRIGGVILPSDSSSQFTKGEWGRIRLPISVKATYYYNVYNSNGEIINLPSNQESITTYAERLSKIVELVKYRTGRNKVNIVAHSMGGLVAREYIKKYNGDSSVNKLIMIGSPNHGIYESFFNKVCPIFGANTECSQMKAGSDFLNNLNIGNETIGNVKYYNIIGSGCTVSKKDGDGIVRSESAAMKGAKNVYISGKCEDYVYLDGLAYHPHLVDVNKYPQVYSYVKQFLQE